MALLVPAESDSTHTCGHNIHILTIALLDMM